MNAVQIKKRLVSRLLEFEGLGRAKYHHEVYLSIIDAIMSFYYSTPSFDFEEARTVFDRFVKTGILDFRTEASGC